MPQLSLKPSCTYTLSHKLIPEFLILKTCLCMDSILKVKQFLHNQSSINLNFLTITSLQSLANPGGKEFVLSSRFLYLVLLPLLLYPLNTTKYICDFFAFIFKTSCFQFHWRYSWLIIENSLFIWLTAPGIPMSNKSLNKNLCNVHFFTNILNILNLCFFCKVNKFHNNAKNS